MALTSAAGLVALLDDKGPDIKAFALKRLDELVDEFWAEISESVNKIEILHEDLNFTHNKLAALLASKVYYHLGEHHDSLYFALCAEELFDISQSTEFVETIISKCIDKYTALRVAQEKANESPGTSISKQTTLTDRSWNPNTPTYKRLEHVVNKMFERCLEHKQYKQALGIAIETRRLDIFEKAINLSDDRDGMLRYAFRVVLTLVDSVRLRNRFLRILVNLFTARVTPTDSVNMCQCLVLMDDPQATADTLERLLLQSQESAVTAYQIGFDLYENATQNFLQRVSASLARSPKLSHVMTLIEKEKTDKKDGPAVNTSDSAPATTDASKTSDPDTKDVAPEEAKPDQAKPVPPVTSLSSEALTDAERESKKRLEHLISILSGDKVIELHLQFLIRNNKADLRLLERIKDEVRHSVTHNATVLANGIMHCGTTSDQFLRDHLNWLGKAVNWAKFTATATLGVIHKGHEKEALRLMSAYLPRDASGSSGSVYTEGGGLFALGLIHANHGGTMTEYLLNQSKEATAEPVRHGACLGLGLAAMGTGREDVYDQIKLNLYQDDAITGEAAGIGIGLVMLGTGSTRVIEDLLGYAKETAHEKIIRGIALGIALVMYGRQEEADDLIDSLISDNDPILRWSGMATIAMAYCGAGSNQAIQRLLHAAVSDTNDDVRRWAVTALGFISFKTPEQVPPLVSLLAESYHPHLRYGSAMAVGIACAGTAVKEAVSLLENLLEGSIPFVRQGALIAMAMVLIQQNGVTCPKSVEFREKCLKVIGDRHEDLMAKFGAILACGILDAGGCNMTISLQTRTGNSSMAAAVGLLVFQNFWFWHPLTNFLSLALTPTALIALNKDLKMPKMQFRSNAKPSTFAYPPPLQIEKEKKKEKVETAVLSITAKHRKKEADKKHQKQQQQQPKEPGVSSKEEKMDIDPPKETAKEVKESAISKEDKEPNFSLLSNPARVMRAQQRVMTLPDDARYFTVKPITQGGILMVHDRRPQDTEVFVETVHGHGPTGERSGGVAGSGAGASGLATALSSGIGTEGVMEQVHASTLGAYLDEDDDEEDEEDEDEDESSEGDEDEEDDDEEYEPAVVDEGEVAADDVEMEETAARSSKSKREKSRTGGRTGTASNRRPATGSARSGPSVEPAAPEPFLFVDESNKVTSMVTSEVAGTSAPTPVATTSKSIGGESTGKTDSAKPTISGTVAETVELMDVDSAAKEDNATTNVKSRDDSMDSTKRQPKDKENP